MKGRSAVARPILEGMIPTFLRPPRSPAELLADGMRVLGVVSIVAAIIGWPPVAAGVLGLVLIGLVLPRFLGIRPPVDAAICIVLLIAGWSSVIDVYGAIAWWDILVHFALNGLIAAMLYILLIRVGFVPDPAATRVPLAATVTLTVALGLAAGVLWEVGEWAGHTFVDERIFVGYTDSIGDLAVGGAGALAAGLAGRYLAGDSRFVGARTIEVSHAS